MKLKNERIHFIDNIKIALIMLVVAHHAGQAYGPGGWWFHIDDESMNWLGKFFSIYDYRHMVYSSDFQLSCLQFLQYIVLDINTELLFICTHLSYNLLSTSEVSIFSPNMSLSLFFA